MEPIKIDDLGVPPFHPISGNLHMVQTSNNLQVDGSTSPPPRMLFLLFNGFTATRSSVVLWMRLSV